MTSDLATAVHLAILAAGVLTWLFALRFHRRTFAPVDPTDARLLRRGHVEVDAPRAAVEAGVASALGSRPASGAGLVELESASGGRVAGTIHPFGATGTGRGLSFDLRLVEQARRTTAFWRLSGDGRSGLRTSSALFVYLVSPAALAAAAIVMHAVVLASEDAGVRTQAVQTVQVVHFLWPPFLLAGIFRRAVGAAERILVAAIRNSAFLPVPGAPRA